MQTQISDLAALQALTHKHGFDCFGVCSPSMNKEQALNDWLSHGFHGQMAWMETRVEERAKPLSLWRDVKSILVLGVNYAPDHSPLDNLAFSDKGLISVYAQGKDYHDVIKPRLKALARDLIGKSDASLKVFVDTAPVMEKPLAALTGLGWQGKHSNIVSRDFGSWLFLGVIYCGFDLPFTSPSKDNCGSCSTCLDICPTKAFPQPYVVNAQRCISYLTIEHKGFIPRELRPLMGNRIYGCDDCLAVCPWNKFAVRPQFGFLERSDLHLPLLKQLVRLTDGEFREMFKQTPIKRIGRERFIRNVLNAIANSRSSAFVDDLVYLLKDDSEVVRGMAVYALGVINKEMLGSNVSFMHGETSNAVLEEWSAVFR